MSLSFWIPIIEALATGFVVAGGVFLLGALSVWVQMMLERRSRAWRRHQHEWHGDDE